jgi:hypothetical protein
MFGCLSGSLLSLASGSSFYQPKNASSLNKKCKKYTFIRARS